MNKFLCALSLTLITTQVQCEHDNTNAVVVITPIFTYTHTNSVEYPSYEKQFETIRNLPRDTPQQRDDRLIALSSLKTQIQNRTALLNSDLDYGRAINLYCMAGLLKSPICDEICKFVNNANEAREDDHGILEEITTMFIQEATHVTAEMQSPDDTSDAAQASNSDNATPSDNE